MRSLVSFKGDIREILKSNGFEITNRYLVFPQDENISEDYPCQLVGGMERDTPPKEEWYLEPNFRIPCAVFKGDKFNQLSLIEDKNPGMKNYHKQLRKLQNILDSGQTMLNSN